MILTKSEYLSSINELLPDNSRQEISPLDLRTSLINLVDSVHLMMDGRDISAGNFSTPDTRTTKAGEFSLINYTGGGRSTADNSAFGYATLRPNFNGSGNTAIGSHAMSCNIYGSSNTAVGYQTLAGNTRGSGNIGVGNYALNNNKTGDFNIAIGHGAGYYIGRDDNYKLYVGSHEIGSGHLCDVDGNPVTTGPAPLLYGDLTSSNLRLAIGTNSLHDHGTLQVAGKISPSDSESYSLGTSQKRWSGINDFIVFSGDNIGIGGSPSGAIHNVNDAKMTVYGDLVPSQNGRFALGYPGGPGQGNHLMWDAYLNDVIISGQLTIFDESFVLNEVSHCLYECKTLHLATSGFCDPEDDGFHNSAVCGFLNDTSLDGAGFIIHSSGGVVGESSYYVREYEFLYRYPDASLSCLGNNADNAYSRSRWESNISIEIPSGKSLIAERTLGRTKLANVIQSGCMGVFLEPYAVSGQRVVVGQEPHFNNRYPTLQDANFISRSGTHLGADGNPVGYDYSVMYGTVDSGVKVMQKFSSRIKSSSTSRGFSIVYHDELDQD